MPKDENEAVEEEGVKLAGEAEVAMNDVHDMDYDTLLIYRSKLPCSIKTRGGYLIKFLIT